MNWWYQPTGRLIMWAGAAVFGAFFVTAFILRRAGVSDDVTVTVAGILAWGFLGFTAVVLLTGRQRARGAARSAAVAALKADPGMVERVGTPVQVTLLEPGPELGAGETWDAVARATGSIGEATVRLHMVRDARGWHSRGWENAPSS